MFKLCKGNWLIGKLSLNNSSRKTLSNNIYLLLLNTLNKSEIIYKLILIL